MSKLTFTATAMEKPSYLSLKASLAWDYLEINSGTWMAARINDDQVIVTDESGNINGADIFDTERDFIDWLEEVAEQQIEREPVDFFCYSHAVKRELLYESVIEAIIKTIKGEESK